jgi:NADH:ubiquinone oxidoreductase subunit H
LFFLAVAFLVLFERFLLGLVQARTGPRVVRFFGLLQTITDGGKLFFKGFFGFLFFAALFFGLGLVLVYSPLF